MANLSDRYGAGYALPDDVLSQVRPFSDYILLNTEELQKQWLQELFVGDEWALIGAGVMNDNSVRIAVPEMPASTPAAIIPAPAPVAPSIPRPTAPVAKVPAPASPKIPTPSAAKAGPTPTPAPAPTPAAAKPKAPTAAGVDLSDRLMVMVNRLKDVKGGNA